MAKDPSQSGKRRDRVEFFTGDQVRKTTGDWVEKERLIDRNNDRYLEVVKEKATGRIIHRTEERLSEHKGRGSAKFTRSRESLAKGLKPI